MKRTKLVLKLATGEVFAHGVALAPSGTIDAHNGTNVTYAGVKYRIRLVPDSTIYWEMWLP